jgi:phenylacetate-CoA ligase
MDSRYYDSFETASHADIDRIQHDLLLKQLAQAVEQQPLTRALWRKAGLTPSDIRSVEDFKARAPFMDKDMIRAWRDDHGDPFGGILTCAVGDVNSIGSSSGTTGDPTLFAYRWHVPGSWIFHPRQLWELGLRAGDYAMDCTINARGTSFEVLVSCGAIPIMADHNPDDLRRILELSRRYRPKLFFLASSPLVLALEQLESQGIPVKDSLSSYEAVVFTGEPLSPRLRSVCERWGLNIYQMTSLGDSGTAFECREQDGFHAFDDLALIEAINPQTGAPVADGERGEMVVTNLVDPTAPLIRYRTGDLVRLTREPCKCGRTHSRFWVDGRAGDELIVRGRSIIPLDIWALIESVPACSAGLFQIIRSEREAQALHLRIGNDGSEELTTLLQQLENVLSPCGVPLEIELVPNSELLKLGPPHKIPRVSKK